MIYFDTNVYVYAFSSNVDDIRQKNLATKLIEEAILKNTLLVSDVVLCEFVYVLNKIGEDSQSIDANVKFLSQFIKPTNLTTSQMLINFISTTHQYQSSFDIFHITFAEYFNANFITFDKGFKKLKNLSGVKIEIF